MSHQESRTPEFAIDPLFVERWSPRAYTGEPISEESLLGLLEAARWAPSSYNSQPWRFIYALNGSKEWPALLGLLAERNQRWATKASALVILVSKKTHLKAGESQPSPLPNHSLDAGAAWIQFALQAARSGWRTRAMGGFDRDRARAELGIPDDYHVEVAIAIGRQADRGSLPEELQALEKPNQRRPLRQLVAAGRFSFAAE